MATGDNLVPSLLNLKKTLVDCNTKLEELQKSKLEEIKGNKLVLDALEEARSSTPFDSENEQQQKIKRIHDRRRAGRRTMRSSGSSGSSIDDDTIPEENDDEGTLQMSTVFDIDSEGVIVESLEDGQKSNGIPSEEASESNALVGGFCNGHPITCSNVSLAKPRHRLRNRGYRPRRNTVIKEVFYPQTTSFVSNGINFLAICAGVLMLQISFNLLPLIQFQIRAGNSF